MASNGLPHRDGPHDRNGRRINFNQIPARKPHVRSLADSCVIATLGLEVVNNLVVFVPVLVIVLVLAMLEDPN